MTLPPSRETRRNEAHESAAGLQVDADIRRSRVPSASLYRDSGWYERVRDRVLVRGWHVVARSSEVQPGTCLPLTLLQDTLDEPLVATREPIGTLRLLSNACTHRAALVVEEACRATSLRCRAHGRRYGLDGRFTSAPGFARAAGFPSSSDDLPQVPTFSWADLLFASLDPAVPADELLAPVEARTRFLKPEEFVFDPAASRVYEVDVPWLLPVENYLEELHVPHVHPGLSRTLDLQGYRTLVNGWLNLQLAVAADGEPAFEPPPGHPEHGLRVAAWYFFVFPATMLNFYPWGLSVNSVRPAGPARTRIAYLTYVRDASVRGAGAGGDLDTVEREDQALVRSVWRGLQSRLWRAGRHAPDGEAGLHHFHRQLAVWLG